MTILRKKPTHIYIIECLHGSKKRGAIFTYYTGITNNPARRQAEHYQGTGARYTAGHRPQRMVVMELEGVIQGIYTTAAQLEDTVQRFKSATKRAIVRACFGEISTLDVPDEADLHAGDWLWQAYWKRCPNGCQASFTRDLFTGRLVIAAIIHLGEGGPDCSICKGKGGIFISEVQA